MFSLAYDNYLDPLDIFTRFQVAIMEVEFSTGEMKFFKLKPIVNFFFFFFFIRIGLHFGDSTN